MVTTIIVIIIYYYINDNIKVHSAKLFPFQYARGSEASERLRLYQIPCLRKS